jgi:hypothetical protein
MAQSLSGHAAKRKLNVPVHKQIPALPLVRHLREPSQLISKRTGSKLSYYSFSTTTQK